MDPKQAEESVAERFTRVMNATPSPLGPFSDLTWASALAGAILVLGLFVIRRSTAPSALYEVIGVALVPLLASLLLSLPLRGSRRAVVRWLAAQPFPVENLNALLAGLGDTIEVHFEPSVDLPARPDLQPKLDEVSDDVVLVKERPEERSLEIRLGIVDSKRLPLYTHHQRWLRLVAVVGRVLVPLSKTRPIRKILII